MIKNKHDTYKRFAKLNIKRFNVTSLKEAAFEKVLPLKTN